MKKLNNKGYMLVEIIFASVIAFGVAYFLLDLVIKLKNKNDDLFVDTLARTDQAIITNTIMRDIYADNVFSCDNIEVTVDNTKHKITYKNTYTNKTTVIEVNKYTKIGEYKCSYGSVAELTTNSLNTNAVPLTTQASIKLNIKIPLTVTATSKSYDVVIEKIIKSQKPL